MVAFDGLAAPVNVIAPANTLPFTVEPLFTVAVRPARTVPFQVVPDPIVISPPAPK